MLREIDDYYLSKEEPLRSCLIALRDIILAFDNNITAVWRYCMPFFYYKGKMFCYLWVHKKSLQPYIGIVEGKRIDYPGLIQNKRAKMKIMLFDPQKDLSVETINSILLLARDLY